MHYILCEILIEYQLGWNIEYLEYLSICVYFYDLKLFQINVIIMTFIVQYLNQPLNQLKFINASYDTYCEKYLLKLKFMKLSNFAWFIDLFMISFNQRYSLRYHIFYIRWVLFDNSDYQSNTIYILYRLPIFPHLMGIAW